MSLTSAPAETAFVFDCQGDALVGITSVPAQARATGVVVVVGGPQYRVGSHRQFVHLSRYLAGAGFASLRFDYRGMGDSSGAPRGFEDISHDLRAAIDVFLARAPPVRRVVLWGLCDGASAACLYAHTDARVCGVVLANPWVRTDEGAARVMLTRHYIPRALSADLWLKLLRGQLPVLASARALCSMLAHVMRRTAGKAVASTADHAPSLPDRLALALQRFRGPRLLILSGKDYTAAEFEAVFKASPLWQRACSAGPFARVSIEDATHTFSRLEHKAAVAAATAGWLLEHTSGQAAVAVLQGTTVSGAVT